VINVSYVIFETTVS